MVVDNGPITDPQVLDDLWMNRAIGVAKHWATIGWRPFGAIVVNADGEAIGWGYGSERPTDPTRHSEMVAIREACEHQNGLLHGCTLYSTHEPCTMCCGAIKHSKLSRVVWGSERVDIPQLFRPCTVAPAVVLLQDTTTPPETRAGVLRKECLDLFTPELNEKLGISGEKPYEFDHDAATRARIEDECNEATSQPRDEDGEEHEIVLEETVE